MRVEDARRKVLKRGPTRTGRVRPARCAQVRWQIYGGRSSRASLSDPVRRAPLCVWPRVGPLRQPSLLLESVGLGPALRALVRVGHIAGRALLSARRAVALGVRREDASRAARVVGQLAAKGEVARDLVAPRAGCDNARLVVGVPRLVAPKDLAAPRRRAAPVEGRAVTNVRRRGVCAGDAREWARARRGRGGAGRAAHSRARSCPA